MAEYICFEASTSDESDSGEILTEAADIAMIDDSEQPKKAPQAWTLKVLLLE